MRATLSSKHTKYPFETATVKNYKMEVLGDPHALAKGYDKANIMTVVLRVAKSNYQSEEIQTIIKWSREPYISSNYYRDLAMHLDVKEDFKKTIVFTHARITVDIRDNTREDDLTIIVTAYQKEDKMSGVCFGQGLEETYEKAEKRVANPPRLNIYMPQAPVAGHAKQEKREYANDEEIYKPVMIKYIAEQKKCTAKLNTSLNCIQIYNPKGEIIRNIFDYYTYQGRTFCSSKLFKDNFNNENFQLWHERTHKMSALYENRTDAEMALGSIYFKEDVAETQTYAINYVSGKYKVAGPIGSAGVSINLALNQQFYYNIKGNKVLNAGTKKVLHDMSAIYQKAEKAWGKAPEEFVNIRSYSREGLQFICDEEMTVAYGKAHGLIHFDNADEADGIYPHYAAANSEGYTADGVLTVGYGIAIPSENSVIGNHQYLINECNLKGKKFNVVTAQDFSNFYGQNLVTYKSGTGATSSRNFPVRVPNTSYLTFEQALDAFEELIPRYVELLNDYLDYFNIYITKQHQYDALLSLCYNTESWTKRRDLFYDFTQMMIDGGETGENDAKAIGDEIASWRDNKARRRREGDLFEKAEYNPAR